MTKKKAQSTTETDIVVPKALLETLTASALVSAGKFAYDASKDAYVALKPDKPLKVAIEESQTTESGHRITAMVSNYGDHSAYLESLRTTDPKNVTTSVSILGDRKIGRDIGNFGRRAGDNQPPKTLPHRLSANETVRLHISMSLFPEKRRSSKPYATLALKYTVLGVASKPKHHKFDVAIRDVS